MPSSIYVDGKRMYVPGIYGKIDASALAAAGLTVGGIAVVGSFPTLEYAEPKVFYNSRQVAVFDPDDKVLARIAQMAFSPSTDTLAPGGANPLIIVNAQDNAQASRTFDDSTGYDALTLKSKLWGVKGNRVNLKISANTTPALTDIAIKLDGRTETYTALGSGSMLSVGYQSPVGDTQPLTGANVQVSPRTSFSELAGTFNAGAPPADITWAPTKILPLRSGVVSVKLGTTLDPGKTVVATLTGYDTTGTYQTEAITLLPADTTVAKAGAKFWSKILGATVTCDQNGYAGTVTISGSADQALRFMWEKSITHALGVPTPASPWQPTKLKNNNSEVIFEISKTLAGGKVMDITVIGHDHTGAAVAEPIQFAQAAPPSPAGPGTKQTIATVTKWSDITSVAYSTDDNLWDGTLKISGESFYIPFSATKTLKQVADEINVVSALGYFATVDNPKSGSVLARECDEVAATDCFTAAGVSIRADLWAIIDGLSGSSLVTAERASNAGAKPAAVATAFLLGGTESAAATNKYADAYASLLVRNDVQKIVAFGDEAFDTSEANTLLTATALVTHIRNAATSGRECSGYVGWPYQSSKAISDVKNFIKQINSRSVTVGAQKIVYIDPDGTTQTLATRYRALQQAAMKVAVGLCEPVTNKRPTVSDVISIWTAFQDDNEVIPAGISALTYDEGWKELRGVTSYLTDDNPVLSEESSVESCDTSIRMLRAVLKSKLGGKNTITANKLGEMVESELKKQVASGVIKDYRNISVDDDGDVYNIAYDCAPIEPFNFANIELRAVRF